MTFQAPHFLWLLLALLPATAGWMFLRGRAARRTEQFAARETWSVLNTSVSRTARAWRTCIMVAAMALAIVAAARPLWGTRERQVKGRGIDILFAIDVSRSMFASDMNGSTRLAAAKLELGQVLDYFPGQRVGIIPFAGDAFLQCPLTTDYGIARSVLERLSPESTAVQGTNIGAAIDAARQAYSAGALGSRVLVLVTDGENHEESLAAQIEKAAQEGVRVYCLGIGSEDGTLITTEQGTTLKDSEGKPVLSRLDSATLARIADATGGVTWVTKPGERLDVRPLIGELEKLEGGEFDEKDRKRLMREERYQIPLAIALSLFFVEGLFGDRRRAARGREGARA